MGRSSKFSFSSPVIHPLGLFSSSIPVSISISSKFIPVNVHLESQIACIMNFIAYNKAYSLYPAATLEKRTWLITLKEKDIHSVEKHRRHRLVSRWRCCSGNSGSAATRYGGPKPYTKLLGHHAASIARHVQASFRLMKTHRERLVKPREHDTIYPFRQGLLCIHYRRTHVVEEFVKPNQRNFNEHNLLQSQGSLRQAPTWHSCLTRLGRDLFLLVTCTTFYRTKTLYVEVL
jgi:hypothetical protein